MHAQAELAGRRQRPDFGLLFAGDSDRQRPARSEYGQQLELRLFDGQTRARH